MPGRFQVELGGNWRDYSREEDKILKRAYMTGFPTAKFHLRGQDYIYDFKNMVQINKGSRKQRRIRQPHKWNAPKKPIVPSGPTTVVTVPPGSPGTTIQVPHPKIKGAFISVNVPAGARPGQAMLVPVPEHAVTAGGELSGPGPAPAAGGGGGGGWSTGAKVAAGGAAAIGVGGLAVGGAVLGMHAAEHGVDATVDAVGDGLADAGEAIGDFAVDAGEFIVDAGEEVGDFVMDLF